MPLISLLFAAAQDQKLDNAVQSLTGTPRSDLDSVNWTRGYISALESLLEINFEDTLEND